jgi:hypothetical protein
MANSTIFFLKKAFALFALVFFFFGPSSAKNLPPPPKKNTGHKVFVAFYIAGKQGA